MAFKVLSSCINFTLKGVLKKVDSVADVMSKMALVSAAKCSKLFDIIIIIIRQYRKCRTNSTEN